MTEVYKQPSVVYSTIVVKTLYEFVELILTDITGIR